jgi:hypothetical protein
MNFVTLNCDKTHFLQFFLKSIEKQILEMF